MSSNDLKIDDDVQETKDSLGGSGYVWDSAIYPVLVDLAYQSKSAGGAIGVNLVLKGEDGRELRNTLWVKSGPNAKTPNATYYVNAKGDKFTLPGMNHANALALLTTGKDLNDLDKEEKVVKLWDAAAGGEVNTKVEVFTELLQQRIDVGIIKQIVNKQAKGDDGKYRPTNETRDENEIDKMFRAEDGLTVTEIKAGETEPEFYAAWEEKWTGVVKNKVKTIAGSGTSGGPAGAPSKTKKLFPTG